MRPVVFLLLATTLALAPACRAQTPSVTAHAPDGASTERIQSISIFPKTAAPFSATVVTVWTRLLEDGTRTVVKNHRTVARDSAGRIFEERRFFSPNGDAEPTRLSRLEYSDPAQHEFFSCDPDAHICLVSDYRAPATLNVNTQPTVTLPNGAGTIQRTSLGQTTMSNLEVIGSREITSISPGANGYTRSEPTVKEFWYSPFLDINLIVKRFEPRGGAQDFTVQNLNLAEPDPRLFSPPADYKIIHTSRY